MRSNPKRLFLIYALIIGVLGAYALHLWHQKQAQFEQYYSLTQTEAKMNSTLERVQYASKSNLEKSAHIYPSFLNENLYRRSKIIQKHCETMENSIHTQIGRAYKGIDSKGKYRPSLKGNYLPYLKGILSLEPQTSAFFEDNRTFIDSLYLFAKNNPQALVGLDSIFSLTHRKHDQKIIAGSRDDQKAALLSIWELNHTSAACQVLASMEDNIEGVAAYRFEALIPIVTTKNGCVRAGEVFRGEVSPLAYSPNSSKNLTAFINNKPIAMTQGLGQYRHRYQTPGIKKVNTKLLARNPLTKEVRTLPKPFFIQICE